MSDDQSPETGKGRGVQLEAVVSYDITPAFSVGVGGRYWAMWTDDSAYVNIFGTPCPCQTLPSKTERAAEVKTVLSHFGNSGRHTFATQASLLKIDDKIRDILSGRTLIKTGVAGSGYLDRKEFGPDARRASQKINDRIDQLAKLKKT
ncbi:MAG: hypothetical protein AB7S93_06265 [Xanthobacteraceae bacterium]